jgi:PilZ domain-containing protein
MDLQTGIKVDARRAPRIRLEVEVNIHSSKAGLVPGRTVDVSESGISALLPVELPIGEVVKLEIASRLKPVRVGAVVRNRNASRYGFEFEQPGTGRELIKKFP